MSDARPLDSLGRQRSPAAVPGCLTGRPSRNKGRRYPADPPRTEEIIAVMRCAGDGLRRAGPQPDRRTLARRLAHPRSAGTSTSSTSTRDAARSWVRCGKGGRRREVGMDDWAFDQLQPWLTARQTMPVGPLFCVINGHTRGRAWSATAARAALRRRAAHAGVRRRFVPHQLRHTHAIELARAGVPLNVIQRQLGHRNLGVTSIYLQGIDPGEIIETVHARRPPMIPASAGLALPFAV
jgi:hypothetical protein